MSDQKTVLMINANINKENMAEVQSYLGQIMPIFIKNGGQPVARYKTIQLLAGDENPEMTAIVEFPDAAAIDAAINSEDFNALAELRARVFTKLNMMICASL
jgi:uncharacterized protein (DUF1330 family)